MEKNSFYRNACWHLPSKRNLQLVSVVRKTAPTQMPSPCSHCRMKCFKKDLIVCFPGSENISKVPPNFQEEGLELCQGRKKRMYLVNRLRNTDKSFGYLTAESGPGSTRENCHKSGGKAPPQWGGRAGHGLGRAGKRELVTRHRTEWQVNGWGSWGPRWQREARRGEEWNRRSKKSIRKKHLSICKGHHLLGKAAHLCMFLLDRITAGLADKLSWKTTRSSSHLFEIHFCSRW